jgi:phosphoadenosine phosphosulfate reductase
MDLNAINERLADAEPEAILDWAFRAFPYRIGMTTSFQASGVVLLDIIRKIAYGFPVFFIDTGHHFPETLDFKNRLARAWGLDVHVILPTVPRKRQERESGPRLYDRDPELCCRINKIEPLDNLKRELGLKNWLSAVRRDQSPTRRDFHPVMIDGDGGLRIHPLVNWTRARIWDRIRTGRLPYHPLYDQGYKSIGCFPPACTAKTSASGDEDERNGRWEGRDKVECGLHLGLEPAGKGRDETPPKGKTPHD